MQRSQDYQYDGSTYTEADGHGIIDTRAGTTVALGLTTTASTSANLKQTGSGVLRAHLHWLFVTLKWLLGR